MQESLFAYGSLSDGQIHFPRISSLVEAREPALVRGSMIRLRCGFPALHLCEAEAQWVEGELLHLETPEVFWFFVLVYH